MFGLGYSTDRDTSASRFAGDQNGKPTLVFSEDTREAFRSELSLRTVSFANGPVDHFGNLPGEDNGARGGRGTFWLPSGPVPASEESQELWVREVAAGRKLRQTAPAL